MEKDSKRIGGGLEEDWSRTGGGLEEDSRIGGGLREYFRRSSLIFPDAPRFKAMCLGASPSSAHSASTEISAIEFYGILAFPTSPTVFDIFSIDVQ